MDDDETLDLDFLNHPELLDSEPEVSLQSEGPSVPLDAHLDVQGSLPSDLEPEISNSGYVDLDLLDSDVVDQDNLMVQPQSFKKGTIIFLFLFFTFF